MIFALVTFFSFGVLLIYSIWRSIVRVLGNDLPPGTISLPGPKGLPGIGCVHQLEDENPWLTFHKWALEYGPIYQVNLGGQNHVWIADEDIAHELLSKKHRIYSDRPHIPALIHDNRNSGEYLPLMSNNELWSRQRKFAKSIMNRSQQNSFYGYPELEAKRLMKELLESPEKYNTHLESYISRVTSRLAWGHSEAHEELKQRARELLIGVSPTGALGNKLPFLMSLPDWIIPAKAWERRRMNTERVFFETMQNQVECEIGEEKASPSWTKHFLEFKNKWGFKDDAEGAYAVGMHGIAGALTIAAPMQGFCLAILHHPSVLPRLHEELDKICPTQPPSYADLPRLPYLRACIREALRWRPPVPTGIPHLLNQPDIYKDQYYIPANSVIHPLEWSMSRNTKLYPFPETFLPERWLEPSYPTYKEPLTKYPTITGYSQFGFGARKCLGQEVTEADLFVGIGALAWGFEVRKAVDGRTGLERAVGWMRYSKLLIAKPRWFEMEIRPRSEERAEVMKGLFVEEEEKGRFEVERRFWDEKNAALGWSAV